MPHTDEKLILALPSKGRIETQLNKLFADKDIHLTRPDARGYFGSIDRFPNIDVQYLSPAEIARRIINGKVHLGITGRDLLEETIPNNEDPFFSTLHELNLGHANLIVALAQDWYQKLNITSMDDLAELAEALDSDGNTLRVATKYIQLAHRFFDKHGIIYTPIYSDSSTEAAIADDEADIIVDITSSGATLKANALQVLDDGVILKTQAVLARSTQSDWNDAWNTSLNQLCTQLGAPAPAPAPAHAPAK